MTTKRLFLADLFGQTEDEIKNHIVDSYSGNASCYNPTSAEKAALHEELTNFDVLVAYESEGDYGCDSASYFLVRDRSSGKLSEVIAGHCSCYGFEGQWDLQEVDVSYLVSDKFYLGCGGYDDSCDKHVADVKAFLQEIAPELEARHA